MLRAIDADTHIFESTPVWDFIDEEMYPRRPIIVSGQGTRSIDVPASGSSMATSFPSLPAKVVSCWGRPRSRVS